VNDTSVEVKAIVRQRYMKMTGEQRMLIAMQMFESARKIVLSSFPEGISENEKRYLLCKRFYPNLAEEVFSNVYESNKN